MDARDYDAIQFAATAARESGLTDQKAVAGLMSDFGKLYIEAHPLEPQARIQDFRSPVFDSECIVYTITNIRNGLRYVGMSTQSFRQRYAECAWWREHHNPALMADVLVYGVAAFHVDVYTMVNEEEAKAQEAAFIQRAGPMAYNIRLESSSPLVK